MSVILRGSGAAIAIHELEGVIVTHALTVIIAANFPSSCITSQDHTASFATERALGSVTMLVSVTVMSTGRISDELVAPARTSSLSGPSSAWKRSIAGLNLTLTALRARIALLALTGCGALLLRAIDLSQWKRILIIVAGLAGIGVGLTATVGLLRHLAFPRGHGGRALALLTFGVVSVVILLDAGAVVRALGLAQGVPIQVPLARADADPVMALIAAGEVVWLAALVPFTASHAQLAGSLGAGDLARRSWRATALVLGAGIAPLGIAWYVREFNPGFPVRAGLVTVAFVLGLIAIAKVVGATRYLAAYLKEMLDPASTSALELSAWRRA